jgi:hypothetical protein
MGREAPGNVGDEPGCEDLLNAVSNLNGVPSASVRAEPRKPIVFTARAILCSPGVNPRPDR